MTSVDLNDIKEGEFPDSPVEVTDDNFEDFSGRFPVTVLDFWAPWCQPCLMMGPILEELSGEMEGKVVFGKINTDENPNTPRKFMIQAIPTMILFKDGELVDQVMGVMPKEKLKEKVQELL